MILNRDSKAVLFKILLHKTKLEAHQYGRVWMLASGAASIMSMPHNQDYYF